MRKPGLGGLVADLHALVPQDGEVALRQTALEGPGGAELPAICEIAADRAVGVVDLDAVDLPLAHLGHEGRVLDLLLIGRRQEAGQDDDEQRQAQQDPQTPLGHARIGPEAPTGAAPVPRRRGRRRREALGAHGTRIGGQGHPRTTGGGSVPFKRHEQPHLRQAVVQRERVGHPHLRLRRPGGLGRAAPPRGPPDAVRPLHRARGCPSGAHGLGAAGWAPPRLRAIAS